MNTIFSTYCSKEKSEEKGYINAVDRYQSNRILRIYNASKFVTTKFMILSGEYGLLKPTDKIPYYDHLLVMEEVDKYTEKITEQLKEINPNKFIFFTESLENEPNLKPYQISIETACKNLNIEFMLIDVDRSINN
jgi:hypothetical protein